METLVKEQTTKKNQLVDIGKGIKVGVVNITPEQAEKMLEHNKHNRALKKGKISVYAMDMQEGLWQMNGVPLIFNYNGELLDGQNRLNAVIQSGVSTEFLVVTGITSQAFKTIDTGANRSGGDVLTTIGIPAGKARSLAALINRISLYNFGLKGRAYSPVSGRSQGEQHSKRKAFTNSMVLDFYLENKQELDDVWDFYVQYEGKVRNILVPSMFLFVFYNLRKINLKDAEIFCSKLVTGDMISSENPIYHLREKLILIKRSETEKVPSWYYPAYTYKAWNAFRLNKPMKKLIVWQTETEAEKPI